ncbi:MAG: hypothetical protein FWF82_03345 [Oscillospiraceae bacterium]|nr:hypothetical protein [Oscillospiraceae bacterium]
MKKVKKTALKDTMALCEEIVKGHVRRQKALENKRADIIHAGGSVSYSEHVGGSRGNAVSDPTAKKTEKLEKLENGLDALFIRVVEETLADTGKDVVRDSRDKLRKAIMLNCENGRAFPYEMLGIDEFSRSEFYRRRKVFITQVAQRLGLAGAPTPE